LAPVIGGACACGITERIVEVAGEQTHLSGMAGRYATALFELALEQNAVDAVRTDLDRFDALIAGNADLLRLIRSPVFSADEQVRALGAILDLAGVQGLSAQFLLTVAGNRHLTAIREALHAVTGKHVQVDVKVDPSILGGLVIKLGSRMVDSSLRTKLNLIRHAMKEVS
jgi:F-type H+-transporting ATPase subunit delta